MKRAFVVLTLCCFVLVFVSTGLYAGMPVAIGDREAGVPAMDMPPMPPPMDGLPAVAPPGPANMPDKDGMEFFMGIDYRHLGLNKKQIEAIRAIKSRAAKDVIRKRADLQIARIELREILDKDVVDMKAAEAKLTKISSLMADMGLTSIAATEEIKANMTPAQRKKFVDRQEPGHQIRGAMHGGSRMAYPDVPAKHPCP